MSGAVNAIRAITLPISAPVEAAVNLVKDGKNPLRSFGESIKNVKDVAIKPFVEGLSGPAEPMPSMIVEDPAAKAAADKDARARAKRKAEVDLLTDQPGRGGVISGAGYGYKA